MDQSARWIRLDADGVAGLPVVCRGFAHSQGDRDAPVCLWGRPCAPVRLDDGLWAEPGQYAFALLVPLRSAPGRRDRWLAWGLSPVVAALRRFGAHAYIDGQAICLHGERIGGASARGVEGCAVVLGAFPAEPPVSGDRGKLLEIDPWLSALNREGRARQILGAFRNALEVQHGWQFDTDWPRGTEITAITAEAVQ